jgi:AcrR family transcriptional regulator
VPKVGIQASRAIERLADNGKQNTSVSKKLILNPGDVQVKTAAVLWNGPDPNTPKGKIFIAATRLFAENGFKGTNTRAITEAAGVKQVMLHYYFGSKQNLYEAVLKYEGMAMLSVIFGADSNHKSPTELLIDIPIRLMTVLHDNPHWASLLRREIADGGVCLRRALRDVADHGPLGANRHFQDAYATATREGEAVNLPVEAVRECLMAIGYCSIYFAPLIAMINERDTNDPVVWEELKLTLSSILRRGLLTPESSLKL